jgi:hypothetical protein
VRSTIAPPSVAQSSHKGSVIRTDYVIVHGGIDTLGHSFHLLGEPPMKTLDIAALSILVTACATPPNDTAAAAAPQQTAKKCDEPATGSNLKRCDRSGVSVVSREEFERMQSGGGGTGGSGAAGRAGTQ